jgi:lipocalin-like protein
VQSRAEIPRIAANDRMKATPDEAQAIVSGSIAYYGSYTLNEADKTISVCLLASTFANLLGPEQKRIITSLTGDELKFTNPRTPAGVTLLTVWKRAGAQ